MGSSSSSHDRVGLYPSVLGQSFEALSPAVREFHAGGKALRARGVFRVERSRTWLGRFIAWCVGFPPAGDAIGLTLQVDMTDIGERWSRDFAGVPMVSLQHANDNRLVERMGTAELSFVLSADQGALVFTQASQALRLGPLRVPLPRWAAAVVSARVAEEQNVLRAEITILAPMLGVLLRYGGALQLERGG